MTIPSHIPLGTMMGAKVQIHMAWVLFMVIIAAVEWDTGHALVLLVVHGLVLLHEFGHVYAARRYGFPTTTITLYPFGGIAALAPHPDGRSMTPRQDLVMSLAGPAVNVVLVIVGLVWISVTGIPQELTVEAATVPLVDELPPPMFLFIYLNFVLAVFNLLPCFPMDGGRVLRALLMMWKGELRGDYFSAHIAPVTGAILAVTAAWYEWWMAAVIVALFTLGNVLHLMHFRGLVKTAQQKAEMHFHAEMQRLTIAQVVDRAKVVGADQALAEAVRATEDMVRIVQSETPAQTPAPAPVATQLDGEVW